MVKIGDSVYLKPSETENSELPKQPKRLTVEDIAYLNDDYTPTTAKNGALYYRLGAYGWIPSDNVLVSA